MSCGAENEANTLLTSLLVGEDVTFPNIDLDAIKIPDDVLNNLGATVSRVSNADLTTTTVDGSGTFDILMRGFNVHLKQEFEKGRITGADYTKAYVQLTSAAMNEAVQFLLQKDQAFWQAQTAQLAAYTARAQFETAKMQLINAKFEALNAKATFALTKLKLATESISYCTAKYQLDNMLPQQLLLLTAQTDNEHTQGDTLRYQLNTMLPQQLLLLEAQTENEGLQGDTARYQLQTMLPQQLALIKEQMEVQRAQTLDNRSDGAAVTGALGQQKALYAQQITSYQRDAEVKAAKLFTDAWITMKTIDEGLEPPTNFANDSLNGILATLKTNNHIGA